MTREYYSLMCRNCVFWLNLLCCLHHLPWAHVPPIWYMTFFPDSASFFLSLLARLPSHQNTAALWDMCDFSKKSNKHALVGWMSDLHSLKTILAWTWDAFACFEMWNKIDVIVFMFGRQSANSNRQYSIGKRERLNSSDMSAHRNSESIKMISRAQLGLRVIG